MRRLHVAAHVVAGAAGGLADEVDDVLPEPPLRIVGDAGEEAVEVVILQKPSDEIVGDGGDSVVAAEALVEGILGIRDARRKRHDRNIPLVGRSGAAPKIGAARTRAAMERDIRVMRSPSQDRPAQPPSSRAAAGTPDTCASYGKTDTAVSPAVARAKFIVRLVPRTWRAVSRQRLQRKEAGAKPA